MRGFFGGKKGGGGGMGRMGFSGTGGSSGDTKKMMMEKLMAAKTGKQTKSTDKMDHATIIKEKLEAKKSELMRASAESKSASFKAAVEQMISKAEKKAKKELAKKQQIEIKARQFTGGAGGRIDSRGNIYDSKGQIVMTVDKNGNIKSPTGMNLGKYDPNSANLDARVSNMIARYSKADNAGSPWGGSSGGGGSDIYGNRTGGGGGLYGPSDDDKGGGWW